MHYILTPFHCTCLECKTMDVIDMIQNLYNRGTVKRLLYEDVYEQTLRPPKYGKYLEKKILLWKPKGRSYCSMVGSCLSNFFPQVRWINREYHVCVTGYSAYNDKDYPFYDFFRYEPEGLRRYVRTMKDDPRWEFYQEGEPFEFEDVSRYSRRLKRERLDRDMVIEYMRQMGYDLEDPSFYETDECYLVEGI